MVASAQPRFGERQLVAPARVYLSPSRVMILDEERCHLADDTRWR
jgi:ABC-type transport system involved in Fe-S cluster assembly fused permease/ATPase subunit